MGQRPGHPLDNSGFLLSAIRQLWKGRRQRTGPGNSEEDCRGSWRGDLPRWERWNRNSVQNHHPFCDSSASDALRPIGPIRSPSLRNIIAQCIERPETMLFLPEKAGNKSTPSQFSSSRGNPSCIRRDFGSSAPGRISNSSRAVAGCCGSFLCSMQTRP